MRFLVTAALAVLAIAMTASSIRADEPYPQGETDLLKLACDYAYDVGNREKVAIDWCRRQEPDVVTPLHAAIKVRIKTEVMGKFDFSFSFHKSLWSPWSVQVEPVYG